MGRTVERSCPKCSYRKELPEGTGMNGRNKKLIRSIFKESELESFERAVQNEKTVRYELCQETGFCERCQDLFSVAAFRYSVNGEKEKVIRKECPRCQGALSFDEKADSCPRCGTKLNILKKGLWD